MWSKRLAIITLGIILAGCHKRAETKVAMPPPNIVTVVVPVAPPVAVPMDLPGSLPPSVGNVLFEQAETAFAMSDYVAAIRDYETYLQSFPDGNHVDEVLFHVGMAYALRSKPPANWTVAGATLRRLVKEHPESPLSPTATLILSLRSHAEKLDKDARARDEVIQQLNAELERLKRIDSSRLRRP